MGGPISPGGLSPLGRCGRCGRCAHRVRSRCPREHAAYLAEHCAEATVRWRAGWHCGWMYDRLWIEAGRGLGEAIDAFVTEHAVSATQ